MSTGPKRVLIIEDEKLVALDIKWCVEGFGYEVCATAGTATDAVALARSHEPDLILMDIRLDGNEEDGISAAEQILAERDTPIIFITAFNTRDVQMRLENMNPAGLILKPFNPAELEQQIKDVLDRMGPEGEATD